MAHHHTHRTWIEVDRAALLANVHALKRLLKRGTRFLAVVKANAYGHGLVETGKVLEKQVDWFGVDSVDEGVALRNAGIRDIPILVMGFTPRERAAEVVRHDLGQVVYDLEMLGALDDAARNLRKPAVIHVKVETGMARQGILLQDLPRFLSVLPEFRGIEVEGAATHLADADHIDDPSFSELQLAHFHTALEVFKGFRRSPKIRHVSGSAAALLSETFHFDLVRFGIAMYGIWPAGHMSEALARRKRHVELEPVLTLKTRIAQVKGLPTGAPVGYGLTERVRRASRIAVLPIGYADGYDRRLSSKAEVLVAGKRAKVLGVVMMNITVVDVTDIPEAMPGTAVTLLGRDGSEEVSSVDLAALMHTIPYEVVARINPLLPRIVV